MKMRHGLLLPLLVLLTHLSYAQTVEVIQKSQFESPSKTKDFAFIEPALDSTRLEFIATISANGSGETSNIELLFHKLKTKARDLRANCFKIHSYNKDESAGSSTLILDTYYSTASILELNSKMHEKNAVYIFGSPAKTDKTYSFKVDDVKKELEGGTYYKHINLEGQQVKINKGGFTGATVWIKWKEDKPSIFLTLTGFGLGGGSMPSGGTGASFNTGRISPINDDLGYLLVNILSESKL